MHQGDPLGKNEFCQTPDMQSHRNRVFGLRGKWNPYAAFGLQLADETAALAGHKRARASLSKRRGNVDGCLFGAACAQFRQDLKNGTARERSRGSLSDNA